MHNIHKIKQNIKFKHFIQQSKIEKLLLATYIEILSLNAY